MNNRELKKNNGILFGEILERIIFEHNRLIPNTCIGYAEVMFSKCL